MRNRINQHSPDAPMSYRDRMAILRRHKIEDTQDKKGLRQYADGDDYGAITPPADFEFKPCVNHPNGGWYGYEGWSKTFYKLMEEHPVFIDPCDAFPNRFMVCLSFVKPIPPVFNPDYPYDDLRERQTKYGIMGGIGADSHFGGDYRVGLEVGWGGLLEKLEKYQAINPGCDDFYDAEIMTVKGVQLWMRHTVEEIGKAIQLETHPALVENLKEMRKNTEFLIDHKPETLRQACEWICWFNMASREYNRDGAGGQLDELLRPYYERDLEAGVVNEEKAKYYLACLLLNDAHYYQVGGVTADGSDMVTYFSYMILEAADWLDSSCNITVRVHKNINLDFLKTSVGYLFKNKNGWPRFSGDDALTNGFMRKGYPKELAVQRVAVGCHWMSLPGMEYCLNDCVKLNNAKHFRIALDEMMVSDDEKSTARLWELYRRHTRKAIELTVEGIMFHLKYQAYNIPELMLNLICHGPVERGLDVTADGVDYYNMCIDGTGIATVADSFAAIEQRVEKEKRLTWEDMYAAVTSNFEAMGGEVTRKMLASSARYGGGNTIADVWAERVSKTFADDVVSMDTEKVKFIPGWFSWSNTIIIGKQVGATPNGRKAGEPINHGANPHPGFRKDGALTAMSNSICAIQPGYGNTSPIQLELDPGMAQDEEGVAKIVDYIRTICEQGSTLLNINIIDANKILAANENPDAYPDLVVRVTGFTAYFCLLTPEFRKLVVDRILIAA
ncbi:MAG: pyruvate formate lyase family protein [Clostridiales bacterium]|nr:pyruvate formate lyase family protein [Clostridiales bacterium]